jgi:hypothetical protein
MGYHCLNHAIFRDTGVQSGPNGFDHRLAQVFLLLRLQSSFQIVLRIDL